MSQSFMMEIAAVLVGISSGYLKVVTKIYAADVTVVHDFFGGARHENAPFVQDVGAVHNFERFADVVVGDEHAYAAFLEVGYKVANISN